MKKLATKTNPRTKTGKTRWGFTLAELIVVITVLAILATVGFVALSGYTQDSRESAAKANVRSVATTIASESAVTGNSPRFYVSHDAAYALSGAFVYVEGTGVSLTGGNIGETPSDSNYTAGKPRYDLLKLDPDKFRIGSKLERWLSGYSAFAAFDSKSSAVGALDVKLGKRFDSWFQVAAVLEDQKKAVVVGTFPNTMTGSNGNSAGPVLGLLGVNPVSGGNKTVLIDGSPVETLSAGTPAEEPPAEDPPAQMATNDDVSTALAFGNVSVNSAAEKTLTLRNAASEGAKTLSVTAGTVAAPFSVTGNTCTEIAAGQSCTVTVRYSPTAQTASSSSLAITPSQGTALTFAMSGTGGGDPYWTNVTGLFRFENTSSPFANTKNAASTLAWSNTSVSHYATAGKFGNAALFDGSTKYSIGDGNLLSLGTSSSYTVEAWTRLDSAIPVSSANWQGAAIFARHGDGTRLFFYYARFPAAAGQPPTHVCVSWSNWLSTFRSADVCAAIPSSALGTWNHVALSHDGTTNAVTINYNGKKLSASTTNTTNLTPYTGPNNNFFVGRTNIGSGYDGYFPGAIDEMRVTVGAARYDKDFIVPTGQYPGY